MSESPETADLIHITADIVAAFVSNNAVRASELPSIIEAVHLSLSKTSDVRVEEPVVEAKAPAVPVKKSITDEFIICLEDGKRFKSLKRHLSTAYNMSPDEYRAKWGLSRDYPMVAPAYASARSSLARQMGLGRKRDGAVEETGLPVEEEGMPQVAEAQAVEASEMVQAPETMDAIPEEVVSAPRKRGRPRTIRAAA